jgi:hypothetical protein
MVYPAAMTICTCIPLKDGLYRIRCSDSQHTEEGTIAVSGGNFTGSTEQYRLTGHIGPAAPADSGPHAQQKHTVTGMLHLTRAGTGSERCLGWFKRASLTLHGAHSAAADTITATARAQGHTAIFLDIAIVPARSADCT